MYEVQFDDGSYSEYIANVIDRLPSNHSIVKGIIGHRKDDTIAVQKKDGWELNKGTQERVITTRGWDIEIKLKDRPAFWCPLTTVKHSMPIDLAEYAIPNEINLEPAFEWRVARTLRRINNIIKVMRVPKQLMKYGIKVPGSVEQAYAFDLENGNTLWTDAIKKELENVIIAFKLIDKDEKNSLFDLN